MTPGSRAEYSFGARKLLAEAGVDPGDLRLDEYEHVDRGVALALGAFGSPRSELVEGAVAIAAEILLRWRTPRPDLVAGLVRCLTSPHAHARGDAAMVLARLVSADSTQDVTHDVTHDVTQDVTHDVTQDVTHDVTHDVTQDVTPAVPALIAAAGDPYDRVSGPAALALARLGRPEALSPVRRWLASGGRLPFFEVTSLGQVLRPMAAHAETLLPGVRRLLADAAGKEQLRPVLAALAAWGPAASAAVPELTAALATRNVRWACDALGAVGAAAQPAADTLGGFVRGVGQPPRHDGGCPLPPGRRRWHGTQNAAWAHWRITGDPEVFLAFLEEEAPRGLGYADLHRLAELGHRAAPYACAVRPLLDSPGPWTRARAAHAWWRTTGDTDAAVPVLLAALRPLVSGAADAPSRAAVRYVARIGAPAAAAAPLLAGVLSSERRYPPDVYPAARAALAAFGA